MPISDQEQRERDKARKRMERQNETPAERSDQLQSERERWASTSHERIERWQSELQSETNEQQPERLVNQREQWSNISNQQLQRTQAERHSLDTSSRHSIVQMRVRDGLVDANNRMRDVNPDKAKRKRMKVPSGEVPIA